MKDAEKLASTVARFWKYVQKSPGCWLWTGSGSAGYGKLWDSSAGKKMWAHRISYEIAHGQIPDGLELDHLCRTPRCVNPRHLEPVTHAENCRRARKTHCKRGHLIRTVVAASGVSRRRCVVCDALQAASRHKFRQG